ncbi:unnamed protein product [Rotaria magnacalcarata]|uniref:Uncharacterized protein n=1 Tax=Rotaria magnacalcarata TaxID=392030 RepID=A0A816RFV6_9BILA|nr:unnamed protein product [Rotaria magnacalcarata]CAF1626126.1 unnamed protein product [Rotaria magnacalcarata]CAF2073071.1 unnamed protein product [Rotaria magnacalcarata]CAF2126188.1 unnamed protein product [Rotaria magnacalcarata]
MKWQGCSQIFQTFVVSIILCCLIQVDGKKIRRRRQYVYNNYGSYALNPAAASYYDPNGADIYSNNAQQYNRFVVGGVAYQYPTPVNVMSGGSYNPQQYNAYPSGASGYYYSNMNNMRLPSPDGWNSAYYFQGYPFLPLYNSAQRHSNMAIIIKLFCMIFTCLICANVL